MELVQGNSSAGRDGRTAALPGTCLHEVFEFRARQYPTRVAVTASDGDLTYSELDRRADGVARDLVRLGVGPDSVIPLYTSRNSDAVVGMLGILKAGGAFLPIAPELPGERVGRLLAQSGSQVAVASTQIAGDLPRGLTKVTATGRSVRANEDTPSPVGRAAGFDDSDLAYVIFTSGSTGGPKGVMVEHRSVIRLFEQLGETFQLSAEDVWSVLHSFGFDFSVWELWGALLYGGRAVIAPHEAARSPRGVRDLLIREGITILSQTPSAFRRVTESWASPAPAHDEMTFPDLRLLIFGGERFTPAVVRSWFERNPDRRPCVINMYGVTETTVHASIRRIRREDLRSPETSPIGRPLADLRFLVLDELGRQVGPGEPGELHIGGPGLARGYLGEGGLTAERFVAHPAAGGDRLYRTGDRVIRREDGEYAFLGRVDDQLKVSGYRIEPREIEQRLDAHPEVEESVVVAWEFAPGDVRLAAYVVPRPGAGTGDGWRERIGRELTDRVAGLPAYMRPSTYSPVTELPLTINGKIDRTALPEPTVRSRAAGDPGAGPAEGPIEEALTEIWCEILRASAVGMDEDFFDLGGTSLALVRMLDRVNARFSTRLDVEVLIETATVRSLVAEVLTALDRRRQNGGELDDGR